MWKFIRVAVLVIIGWSYSHSCSGDWFSDIQKKTYNYLSPRLAYADPTNPQGATARKTGRVLDPRVILPRRHENATVIRPVPVPPPPIEAQRRFFRDRGYVIELVNATDRPTVYRVSFLPSNGPPEWCTFNRDALVNPGQELHRVVEPRDGIAVRSEPIGDFALILVEGFDPETDEKIGEWGPVGGKLGLVPSNVRIDVFPINGSMNEFDRYLVITFLLSP